MKKAPTTFQADGALGEQLSFIPPAPFCPSWPKSNTLAIRALEMFLLGLSLDQEHFLGVCPSWRLAAAVFQLRMIGWPIDTIDKFSPSREHPGRVIALYKSPGKYVAEALALKAGDAHAN